MFEKFPQDYLHVIFFGVFVIFIISTFCACLYSYFREGGASFLNNEVFFDDRYFMIRKQTNYSQSWFTQFPLCKVYIEKAYNNRFMYPFRRTGRYHELSCYNVHVLYFNYTIMFLPLINFLYDEIKDSNSLLSKKLFEKRPFRIDFWNGKIGLDINTIAEKIIKNIPSKNLLTENEIVQIDRVFYEVAINGIMKNPANFEKLKNYLSKIGYRSPEDSLSRQYIYVYDNEHLKLIFEGLSSELGINFNLYDVSYLGLENDIPKVRIESSQNNLREISLLFLFTFTRKHYLYAHRNFNGYNHPYMNNVYNPPYPNYNNGYYPQYPNYDNGYNPHYPNYDNGPRYSPSLTLSYSTTGSYDQWQPYYAPNNTYAYQNYYNHGSYHFNKQKVAMFLLTPP